MKHTHGSIEVVCGSMFSGKTEELIRRLKRVKIANLKAEIFKPAMDTRYDEIKIVKYFYYRSTIRGKQQNVGYQLQRDPPSTQS